MKTTEISDVKLIFIGMALFITSYNVKASATSTDFEPCQKIAVSSLELCLKSNTKTHGGEMKSSACWQSSKKNYDGCVVKVVERYDPAEQKKRQALKKAQATLQLLEAKTSKNMKGSENKRN